MTPSRLPLAVGLALLLAGGAARAQGPDAPVEERLGLDNDSVRLVLLTYPPGADSGLHLNVGPELTLMVEGEITLYTGGGQEQIRAGAAHWLPASSVHLARNEGTRPARFWSLLLKRCD
jgi:quercetin dioxygenase-like cupin family protein